MAMPGVAADRGIPRMVCAHGGVERNGRATGPVACLLCHKHGRLPLGRRTLDLDGHLSMRWDRLLPLSSEFMFMFICVPCTHELFNRNYFGLKPTRQIQTPGRCPSTRAELITGGAPYRWFVIYFEIFDVIGAFTEMALWGSILNVAHTYARIFKNREKSRVIFCGEPSHLSDGLSGGLYAFT